MSIRQACRILEFSNQAYHKAAKHRLEKHDRQSTATRLTLEKVAAIRQDMPRLGARKLHFLLNEELKNAGSPVGRDQLFHILRTANQLVVRQKRYMITTDSSQWRRQHKNLVGERVAQKPEEILVADITYFDTEEDGFVFGHLITDAYSKKILGHAAAADMTAQTAAQTLQMALENRQYDHPATHHSDRGVQYCSRIYTEKLRENGCLISMTQDGSPYDNAIAERINGILKDEFGLGQKMKHLEQVQKQLDRAVHIYNQQRPHWSCQLLTPNQMHQQQTVQIKNYRKPKPPDNTEDQHSFSSNLVNLF